MRINQNIAALNTYRQLSANNVNTSKSLEKLSSGLRINRAGDDAAGLAISEKMRAQVRGLDQASRNSQDAISLIQTAEGALSETQSILQRMRELAVQSASDTNVEADRSSIQSEINQLTSEINRIGNTTEFNTQKLLNGDKFNSFTVTGSSFSGGAASQVILSGTATLLTGGSALNSGTYTVQVSKSVTGTSGVVTTAGVNDGGATLAPTVAEVTYSGGTVKPTFAGSITVNSGVTSLITATGGGASGSGNFEIYLSGGSLVVNVANNSGLSSQDVITADATGSGFVYNNNGISFTITSISGWDSGTANHVVYDKSGNVAADASLGTAQNVWSSVSLGTATTATTFASGISDIALASGVAGGDYQIKLVSYGDSGYLILSGTGGTSGIVTNDVISGIQWGSTFTYNNHGVSFTVSLSGLGSGGSGTLGFSVTKQVTTTTYQTSYTAQLVNASGTNVGAAVALGTSAAASGAAASSGTAQGINSGFSGVVGGGLNLAFTAGTAITVGSGSFTVDPTTGGSDDSLTFQIGANQAQSMSLSINDMRSEELGISNTSTASGFAAVMEVTNGTSATNSEYALDVTTAAGASNAITVINNAINSVSQERSKLGAVQNRLEHTINNLGTSSENLTAAESRVRDVDMARQMMEFTKNNILTQAAQSMLAQANQQPQGVLQLLR